MTQLLLDPFYRTLEGFAVLIEKDWVAFGHMFRERGGFGAEPGAEFSPIFPQFLDAVAQLLVQFPAAFEFTAGALDFLARSFHDRFFVTFLGDSDRARRADGAAAWDVLRAQRTRFRNCLFVPCAQRLRPEAAVARLRVGLRFGAGPGSEVALLRARIAELS